MKTKLIKVRYKHKGQSKTFIMQHVSPFMSIDKEKEFKVLKRIYERNGMKLLTIKIL